jgi:RimJ/RimL family protein N-acetyltransferase
MESKKFLKTFTSKKGHIIVFRYVQREDLDDMLDYINGLITEDTYIEKSGNLVTHDEEEEVLTKMLARMSLGEFVNVVALVDGKYAGSGDVRRGKLRHSHVANLGISIAKEYRDEGIGTELLKTLIDEGKKLGLRLLTLNCYENNERALHVYESLGFKKAGVYPGAISFKGEYIGEVHMYLSLV